MKSKITVDKKLINQAFKGILKRLETTENFVIDQAPDICKQLISEQMLSNVQTLVIAAALFAIGGTLLAISLGHEQIYTVTTHYSYIENSTTAEPTRYLFLTIIAIIVDVIAFFVALEGVTQTLFLKQCPKLFLLRKIKNLLK